MQHCSTSALLEPNQPRGINMRNRSRIDAALSRAANAGEVPGIVAVVASSSGSLYEGAFGLRELGAEAPMTMDTMCFYASMTKALTCTAAMQLVERGLLSLDEPISRVLPDLADREIFDGYDAEDRPILRASHTPITLRQLMTHTAGFGYEIWNADLNRYLADRGFPSIFACEDRALQAPLVREPGTAWEYSISIDLTGKAVEAASGQPLDEYFRDHLFGPLGMVDTTFVLTDEHRTRRASAHARQDDGSLLPVPFEMPENPEFFMGGGGLFGTVGDYVRFLRMILNRGTLDGVQVLKPETVDLMTRSSIGDIDVAPLTTAIPAYSNDLHFYPDQKTKWGLSFLINPEQTAEGRSAGSLAWAGLFNSYYWIDPVRDVAGLAIMQIQPFADERALNVFRDFERAVYETIDAG